MPSARRELAGRKSLACVRVCFGCVLCSLLDFFWVCDSCACVCACVCECSERAPIPTQGARGKALSVGGYAHISVLQEGGRGGERAKRVACVKGVCGLRTCVRACAQGSTFCAGEFSSTNHQSNQSSIHNQPSIIINHGARGAESWGAGQKLRACACLCACAWVCTC